MSAGHRHTRGTADEVELERILALPKVKAYLARPYRVVFHPMILTGGSSVDGRTYFLDPRLKEKYTVGEKRDQDLAPFVLTHERYEKAFREVLGMNYSRGHLFATMVEKREVKAAGLEWSPYKNVMESIVRTDEEERPSFPKGFDHVPVIESRQ
jgi:hypothetical protein